MEETLTYNTKHESVESEKKGSGFGKRHIQLVILFTCVTSTYFTRGCMTVAILGMTDASLHNGTITTFDWGKPIQGIILSSFSWGDLPMQFCAGYLVCKYGGKPFVTISIMSTALLSFLTPFASYVGGWQGVCVVRVAGGLLQGFLSPSIHTILGKWVPTSERNILGNMVFTAIPISTILAMPISAYIAASPLGWPWIFYFFGITCALNGLCWMRYGSNSPAEHKTISVEEKAFVEKSLGQELYDGKKKVPWKAIFTSKPVIAIVATHVGGSVGYTIMLLETPTFFKIALGIELQDSGLLAALPYIAAVIASLVISLLANYLLNKDYLSLTVIRKLSNTMGTWGPAVALMGLMYVPVGNTSVAVSFVILIAGLDALSTAGFQLNPIDLSPNFAAIIVSISLTVTDAGNILAPIITGYILEDPTDVKQWRLVFLIIAGLYFFGNVLYLMWGNAEVQPWNAIDTCKDIYVETPDGEEEMLPVNDNVKNSYNTENNVI